MGAYLVDGHVVIRWDSDGFAARVPGTARALYFSTMYRGQDDATEVLRRYTDLPAELESLVREAAATTKRLDVGWGLEIERKGKERQ